MFNERETDNRVIWIAYQMQSMHSRKYIMRNKKMHLCWTWEKIQSKRLIFDRHWVVVTQAWMKDFLEQSHVNYNRCY